MCISCLEEMRGPQYGDLQWVLGMHRDTHLHFPNGNSARQDLEGWGRKFWRYHLLPTGQQQTWYLSQISGVCCQQRPTVISLVPTSYYPWMLFEDKRELGVNYDLIFTMQACHIIWPICQRWTTDLSLSNFWKCTKDLYYLSLLQSSSSSLPPCRSTNCTTTGHEADYLNRLICSIISRQESQ